MINSSNEKEVLLKMMMTTENIRVDRMEGLLCAMLKCGYADLDMILASKYDFYDIFDEAKEFVDGVPSLNQLLQAMLSMAITDVANYVEQHSDIVCKNLPEEKQEHFKSLIFAPYEDFDVFVNCIDTHVYLGDKYEQYKTYFPKAIEHFEEMTDISIVN